MDIQCYYEPMILLLQVAKYYFVMFICKVSQDKIPHNDIILALG